MVASTRIRIAVIAIASLTVIAAVLGVAAEAPAPGPFERTWARVDRPVADGLASRTWVWGPAAITETLSEPYLESPSGSRTVQYFDKSRMEISHPEANPEDIWYVTNGLLVLEMVQGYIQTGDTATEPREPAEIPVGGDFENPNAPTYRTVKALMEQPPQAEGATITARVDHAGTITDDPALAAYAVTAGPSAAGLGRDQRVAMPFWEFMSAQGTVYEDGEYVEDALFPSEYYATGLPIAPAYWSEMKVGGDIKLVLWQCFERRCLTYTPDNEPGWQIEAGNVGLHYLNWRSEPETGPSATATPPDDDASSPRATGTASPTASATATQTATPTATATPVDPVPPTSTPTPTPTATATFTPTATSTTDPGSGEASDAAACLNGQEEAFLELINDYRTQSGLEPLALSRALNIASYNHSLDMSENDYFSHTSRNGASPWDRMAAAGYDYNTAMAENIAMGFESAQAVFGGWKNSSGHNQNMLNSSLRAIGIGYVSDGHYWTTDFGGYVDAPPSC